MFWERLLKEYIPTFIEIKWWQVDNKNFKIGYKVLISDTGIELSKPEF